MSDSKVEKPSGFCRHITYIQSNFLAKVLKLEEPEVFNEKGHACFIPTCPARAVVDLKQFFHMGDPPIKTYHPVNYIGIGVHNRVKDTQGWYTAYVPINMRHFGNDIYKLSQALIQLADEGRLWLPGNDSDYPRSYDAGNTPNEESGGHTDRNVFAAPEQHIGAHRERYIFATPSCIYATMPEVVSVLNFNGLPISLRIIIEVKVKPSSYQVSGSGLANLENNLDCCFPNEEIEWRVTNLEDVVVQRLLFRIMKKEAQPEPAKSQNDNPAAKVPVDLPEGKTHSVGLIAVMPPSSLLFVKENNFQSLRDIYSSSREDAVTFQEDSSSGDHGIKQASDSMKTSGLNDKSPMQRYGWDEATPAKRVTQVTTHRAVNTTARREPQFMNLKLKWTEHNNKVVFYLKTIITPKWLQWDSEEKLWRVNRIFLYECVKYAIFLGLKVSERVLFALWSWLKSIDMRGIGEGFSKIHLTNWVRTSNIWSFQRVNISVVPGYNPAIHKTMSNATTPSMEALNRELAETVEIEFVPFNKDLLAKFKERNSQSLVYIWEKASNTWKTAKLMQTLEDLLQVLPNLKESSSTDTYLSSRGINLRDINSAQKRKAGVSANVPLKRVNRGHQTDSDDEEDFTTVTKIIITAAGKTEQLMRLKDKIKTVVTKIEPPTSSISASGKVIQGGAGTGGIEFVENPRGTEEWNKVSFCVVPKEEEGELPVDQYDPNLLASLIGEVFIVKENAVDYLLNNFKRWPGPDDTVSYERWNEVVTKNEPRCWGGNSFDGRQRLAQTRLFCDEDFFITGNNETGDARLCRLLIELGNGKIVVDAKDAEYVIITDKLSEEAQELHRLYGKNDEDLIANTHGARHSTLVTPKFIYDCILQWRLQRPTRSHGHLAF